MGGRGSTSSGSIGGLSMQSSDVTRGYVNSTNGGVINQGLRDNLRLSAENQEIVNKMDSAMQSTTKSMTLYREVNTWNIEDVFGIQPKENTFEALKKASIGHEFSDKGFMSTYHTPTGNQYGGTKMVIDAKAGTKALLTSNTREAEVVLGRNQKWKITNVTRDKNKDFIFHITNAR